MHECSPALSLAVWTWCVAARAGGLESGSRLCDCKAQPWPCLPLAVPAPGLPAPGLPLSASEGHMEAGRRQSLSSVKPAFHALSPLSKDPLASEES